MLKAQRGLRRRAAIAACLAAFCTASVTLSAAAFTDTAAVGANTTATGAVDIATDTTSLFPVQNITPGDTITRPLTVTNTGTTDLRYAMRATTTENTLAAALTLTIKNRGLGDASCAAFDGITLYSGPLGSTTPTNQIGDPATGAHVWDRVIAKTTGTDRLCLQVSLPLSSSLASVTTTVTFEFLAEQTANNGAIFTPPTVTGTTTAYYVYNQTDPVPSVTVPAGVTGRDLGIILVGTDGGVNKTVTVPGWTTRVSNPTGQTNISWTVLTRTGGSAAGDVLYPVPQMNVQGNVWIQAIWLTTGGRDITVVGTPGVRNGTSSTTTALPAITTTQPGTDVLVLASERTLAGGTVVSGVSGGASQLAFTENETNPNGSPGAPTDVSHYLGYFTQGTAGSTGARTVTYNTGSTNGVGLLMALELPSATA